MIGAVRGVGRRNNGRGCRFSTIVRGRKRSYGRPAAALARAVAGLCVPVTLFLLLLLLLLLRHAS